MEEEAETPPFWLQAPDHGRGRRRKGGQSSSPFFSTGFVVILLLFIAIALIFFIIPSFLSYTSQVFSPHLVKKGWNSLNLVLVLFAVICGFFSGNRDSESGATDNRNSFKLSTTSTPRYQRSNSSTPRQWYDYSDRDSLRGVRSSNSYPDLRLESQWSVDDDRWRFYDDTRVYGQSSTSNQIYQRRSWREQEEEGGFGRSKDIGVVSEANPLIAQTPPPQSAPRPESPPARSVTPLSPPRPATPPSPPPPVTEPVPPTPPLSPPRQPPPKAVRRKQKRTYQDLAARNRVDGYDKYNFEIRDPEPQSRPPPPPPPPPSALFEKASKSEKKRGGANATKDFLNSLRRKKKKQRQKSVEDLNFLFDPESISYTTPLYPPPSPPPPPPPLPPPAFFRNIFSPKKSTAKKFQSPAPPPPPPPPRRPLETRAAKVASYKAPVATRKPPLPVKMSSIYNTVEDNTDSGNESPLNLIPRPPPPPPFKTPAWKFVVQGDFVRLKSIRSSRIPDPDGIEDPSSSESSPSFSIKSESEGGDSPAAMFCPSPDVDTKADNFIARFRAGLQLEKIDSVKRRSNLGPDLDPSPNPESLER